MLQSLTRHVVVPCAHTTTVHNSYCQSERKCWKRNLFLSLNKPHHPVTSDTIARWLKQVLMEAGVAENSAPSPPVTVQDIVPPCRNKNEHTLDNLHGKCLMAVPIFFTATAYQSWMLCGSLTHSSTSPAAASYISLYTSCSKDAARPPAYYKFF